MQKGLNKLYLNNLSLLIYYFISNTIFKRQSLDIHRNAYKKEIAHLISFFNKAVE